MNYYEGPVPFFLVDMKGIVSSTILVEEGDFWVMGHYRPGLLPPPVSQPSPFSPP